MQTVHRSIPLIVACLAVVFSTGCGRTPNEPAREEIAGRVLVNSKPLTAGRIRLMPTRETKGPATSAAVSDGYFQIPREHGVPAGTYVVQVEEVGPVDLNEEENFAKYRQQKLPAPRLPAQFNERSELLATVKSGEPNLLNLYLDFPTSRPSSRFQIK